MNVLASHISKFGEGDLMVDKRVIPPCDICSLFEIQRESHVAVLIKCKRLDKFYEIERHLCFNHAADPIVNMKDPPRFEGVEIISVKWDV